MLGIEWLTWEYDDHVIVTKMHDKDGWSNGVGDAAVVVKKEKNIIQSKKTSLTVVCNPIQKSEDYLLSMLKERGSYLTIARHSCS